MTHLPFGTYRPTLAQSALIAVARHSFLGRGATRNLIWSILKALRPGPLDVVLGRAAFRLGSAPNGSDPQLLLKNRYDAAELDFLADILDDGIFVDIGANIGSYSLLIWNRVTTIRTIVAIEASPPVAALLSFNRDASNAEAVRVVPVAVGDRDGMVGFAHGDDDRNVGRVDEGEEALRVRMRPLDKILHELGLERCDAVKIDIEGYEDRALLPFFATTDPSAWPRRIVMEDKHAHVWQTDCTAELLRIGYRERGRSKANIFLERSSNRGTFDES